MRDANFITFEPGAIGPGDVVVLGAPWDRGSSYLEGTAGAPARIREALFSEARTLVTESGLDLAQTDRIRYPDDLQLDSESNGLALLEQTVDSATSSGARMLTLGGDHSITPAALRPVSRRLPTLTLVQIDAHPDLYDVFEGDRESHACPMARILEEGRIARLLQIGIRASTPHQRSQAERFGVEVLEPADWSATGLEAAGIEGPIYLTLDLDGLDPAFAPGVSHPEPGGLSTRQVIEIIQRLPSPLVGADVVELNPLCDVREQTAVLAAKLVKEILARLLEGDPS